MSGGLTKKYDYEKGKRQQTAQNPDYRERFQDEGQTFDRGGKIPEKILSLRGSTVLMHLTPFYRDDKESLIRTLQTWRFIVGGRVGTIPQLLKDPKLAGHHIRGRFEIMLRSIRRAEDDTAIEKHPQKNRDFRVLEFSCPFQPVEPYPKTIFKQHLAFSPRLTGPALTGS
jgi:hypothetical protein